MYLMFNKIKAVKDLRKHAKQMQNTLNEVTATGSHGKVEMTMNGNQQILDIQIDDELLQNKEKLIGDLKEAHGDVIKKIQKEMAGKMKDMGDIQEMMKQLGM